MGTTKVAPGLNSMNKSDGFNSGMMARETWMPKNVDELRVDNNPRLTFDLNGHQGPVNSIIKHIGPNDKIGKIEKHLPDKSFESGPKDGLLQLVQKKIHQLEVN